MFGVRGAGTKAALPVSARNSRRFILVSFPEQGFDLQVFSK
jgi:hypothetical protein